MSKLVNLSAVAAFVLCAPASLFAADYYVDCNGSDHNLGRTPQDAWRTVDKVNDSHFVAGDRIFFKRGCTWWNESLQAKWSGSESSPILFSAYGEGERPKLHDNTTHKETYQIRVSGQHQIFEHLDLWAKEPSDYHNAQECKGYPQGWKVGVRFGEGSYENTVRYSKIHGFSAGVHFSKGRRNRLLYSELVDNTVMSKNTPEKYDDDSGAMAVTLNADENEIAYNYFSGNISTCSEDYGGEGASVEIYKGSDNYIHHNIAYNDSTFAELGAPDDELASDNVIAFNVYYTPDTSGEFLNVRGYGSDWGAQPGTVAYNNTVILPKKNDKGLAVVCGPCGGEILEFRNNLVYSNGSASKGHIYVGSGGWDASNNIYWTDTDRHVQGVKSKEMRFVNRSQLVDLWGGDLRLASGSVGRYAGDNAVYGFNKIGGIALTRDITGKLLQNGEMSIGAFAANADPLDLSRPPAWTKGGFDYADDGDDEKEPPNDDQDNPGDGDDGELDPPPVSGFCYMAHADINQARTFFESGCNVSYDKYKGHDCDQLEGLWICGNQSISRDRLDDDLFNPDPGEDPPGDAPPEDEPPKEDPPGGDSDDTCWAADKDINTARWLFETQCGVSYNKKLGHDCDEIDGRWVCSESPLGQDGGDAGSDDSSANGACSASHAALNTAKWLFKETCGTPYDKSKGHDCDEVGGQWVCSTGNID